MKLFFATLFIFVCSLSFAQQKTSSLLMDVTYDFDTGTPKSISVTGISDRKEAWLGVSLYPYNAKDLLAEGTHKQMEEKKLPFKETIELGKAFYSGSFEIGLWGKKVEKKDCKEEGGCYWCKKNGFHLEDLLDYKSGYLYWK